MFAYTLVYQVRSLCLSGSSLCLQHAVPAVQAPNLASFATPSKSIIPAFAFLFPSDGCMAGCHCSFDLLSMDPWTFRRKLDTRAVPVMFERCSSENLTCVDFGLPQQTFSRMRSEGFSFYFEGGEVFARRCFCARNRLQPSATVRDDGAIGGFNRYITSFRVAGVALYMSKVVLCDIRYTFEFALFSEDDFHFSWCSQHLGHPS